MRLRVRATASLVSGPASTTCTAFQPPSSDGSARRLCSSTPKPRASSAGVRATVRTMPNSRPRRPLNASGMGPSGSTAKTATALRSASRFLASIHCSPSSVDTRTTFAAGSSRAKATAGGTVLRRSAICMYAARSESSTAIASALAGPSTASAAITISSQAMATSTACPLAPCGRNATVLIPASLLSVRNLASSNDRPKSLVTPPSSSLVSNSKTSTPRSLGRLRNRSSCRRIAASTCVSRVPVMGRRSGIEIASGTPRSSACAGPPRKPVGIPLKARQTIQRGIGMGVMFGRQLRMAGLRALRRNMLSQHAL